MTFEDAADEYAEQCIIHGKTMKEAISELAEAWADKLRKGARAVETDAHILIERQRPYSL